MVVVVGGLGRYSSNKSSFFITAQHRDLICLLKAIFWDFEEDIFNNQYLQIFNIEQFYLKISKNQYPQP